MSPVGREIAYPFTYQKVLGCKNFGKGLRRVTKIKKLS